MTSLLNIGISLLAIGLCMCFTECGPIDKDPNRTKGVKKTLFGRKSVCMEDLGCFVIDEDFYSLKYRPINLLPQNRDVINTRFLLYTREQSETKHILRAKQRATVTSSTFKPDRETKIIIHGWLDTQLFGRWMADMTQRLLAAGDYNVIVVDWSDGNTFPYTQATANTMVVGAEIAFLIQYLTNTTGAKEESFHIIGHSLGAHTAGYAGKRLKNLGRITGLDPAEPYFQYMPPKVRLDRSDAQFVDVIHTDTDTIFTGGLGMRQAIGHLDFYPNNGRKHPGCIKSKFMSILVDGIAEGVRRIVGCDHQRAVDFFHASIGAKKCQFVGRKCPNWDLFGRGSCVSCGTKGERCAVMGMNAIDYKPFIKKNESVIMYLKTHGDKPFCLHQYQIELQIANVKYAKEVQGTVKLILHGDQPDDDGKKDFVVNLSEDTSFYPGSQYRYVIDSKYNIGNVLWVTFQWKNSANILSRIFTSPKIYLQGIRVTPLNILDKTDRTQATSWLCGASTDSIKPGENIVLRRLKECQKKMRPSAYFS